MWPFVSRCHQVYSAAVAVSHLHDAVAYVYEHRFTQDTSHTASAVAFADTNQCVLDSVCPVAGIVTVTTCEHLVQVPVLLPSVVQVAGVSLVYSSTL